MREPQRRELFAVGLVVMAGEVELDETDPCASIFRLQAGNVHMSRRAGAEFDLIAILRVHVDLVAAVVVIAGEPFCSSRRLTDGMAAAALEDITIVSHVLAVEGLDLVGRVGGLKAGRFNAEMEVAEVEVDIGRVVLLTVVFLDRYSAGIGCEADACDVGILVGLDVH